MNTIPMAMVDTPGVTQEGEAKNFDDGADAQDMWVFLRMGGQGHQDKLWSSHKHMGYSATLSSR